MYSRVTLYCIFKLCVSVHWCRCCVQFLPNGLEADWFVLRFDVRIFRRQRHSVDVQCKWLTKNQSTSTHCCLFLMPLSVCLILIIQYNWLKRPNLLFYVRLSTSLIILYIDSWTLYPQALLAIDTVFLISFNPFQSIFK